MASLTRQQRRAKQREIAKGNKEIMGEEIMMQAHKFMLVSCVVATNYCEDLAKLPYSQRSEEYMNIYCNELDRLAEYCRKGGSSVDWADEETNGCYGPACYGMAKAQTNNKTAIDPGNVEGTLGGAK